MIISNNYPKKFKKKPITIEAIQFITNNEPDSKNMNAIVNWINQGKLSSDKHAWHNGTVIFIETLEGTMIADVLDYVIRGIKGEFYPCKPDVFEMTYEAIKD